MTEVEQVCIETSIAVHSCFGACMHELSTKEPKRVATVLRLALGQMLVTSRRIEGAMREDSARGSRAKS